MKPYSLAKSAVMTFWYFHARNMNSMFPWITIQGKRLATSRYVYKPLENEQVCAEYCREGDRVLDLGCGSGVATVFCAPIAREVIAVDISPSAVRNTDDNCRLHGLANVTVMESDMFSRVEGKFDLIVSHPPYVDAEFDDEEKQMATSVRFVPTLFAQVGEHLSKDGRLIVQFPLWFRARIEKLASEHGLKLVSVRRAPSKSPTLFLLGLLYFQVGLRSAFYQLQQQQQPLERR